MKVLFISHFAGSAHHGMVTRNYNWAVELVRRGHDVTIIAASYSHYRAKQPDMGAKAMKHEKIDGVHYIWVKCPHYNGNSSIGRIIAMASFSMRVQTIIKRTNKKYDLVVASSPHPFVIYPAAAIAKRNNAKLIYDIRDLWPLTLTEIGNIKPWHPFIWLLQRAEDFACRHADLVTAVPQNCQPYLQSRGLDSHKFLSVGNGYLVNENMDAEVIPISHQNLIEDLRQKSAFIIGYAGALGLANAMHVAIESIAKTNNKVHLVIVGTGNNLVDLQSLALKLNIQDRVHFLEVIPYSQVAHFLYQVDCTYIGAINSPLYKWGASPTKVNDYLAAAKPILYAVGDPNNPVEISGCGISCRGEDIDHIASAMNDISAMPIDDLTSMGEKGKSWLYENQTVSKQINAILKKLKKSDD